MIHILVVIEALLLISWIRVAFVVNLPRPWAVIEGQVNVIMSSDDIRGYRKSDQVLRTYSYQSGHCMRETLWITSELCVPASI